MKLLASTLLLCASLALAAVDAAPQLSAVELVSAVELPHVAAAGGVLPPQEELSRRLAALVAEAKSDAELRQEARLLFKLYKALNPTALDASLSEEQQFEKFYATTFKSLMAKAQGNATKAPATAKPASTPKASGATTKPSTAKPSGTTAKPGKEKPKKLTASSKSEPTKISSSLTFFKEVYDEEKSKKVRFLQDNTKNIETVVQSTKGGSTDPASKFQGPTIIEELPEGPTDVGDGGRRWLQDAGAKSPTLLFCDVGGNAIWKWNADEAAAPSETPAPSVTEVIVEQGDRLCDAPKVEIKVQAFQSGCSRQNNPQGCDKVYYKGCGGLAVSPTSNRVVVARTGGRSLGLLYYKSVGNTCQGRVVDAITTYKGKKFNSPTYAEYAQSGDLFFTDSPFGLATSEADFEGDTLDKSPLRELPFNGVFRLRSGATKVDLVDCSMDRPNKIAFSPMQDMMYITNSRKGNTYVKQFPLYGNGSIGEPSVFFNFTAFPELETDEGYADGIKVDNEGIVYVAAYKGVYVFSPAGELIGIVKSNQELNGLAIGANRVFVSGSFGVVAQSSRILPAQPLPKAKTECS